MFVNLENGSFSARVIARRAIAAFAGAHNTAVEQQWCVPRAERRSSRSRNPDLKCYTSDGHHGTPVHLLFVEGGSAVC